MPRNVEIKARVPNPSETRARVESIAGAVVAVLLQEDVFFPVPKGRLKLRFLEESPGNTSLLAEHLLDLPARRADCSASGAESEMSVASRGAADITAEEERAGALQRGELIFYHRPDQLGPKTSEYSIFETDRPHELRAILSAGYGTRAIVKKRRELFFVGRTRVHLDEVQGLGHFLELEVVLRPGEDVRDGEREAHSLMDAFGIAADQLVTAAYVDLLERIADEPLEKAQPSPRAEGLNAG